MLVFMHRFDVLVRTYKTFVQALRSIQLAILKVTYMINTLQESERRHARHILR